ncbi:copper resistance protein CopZ [Methylobacterium sp. Leaf85]|nr:copper resistance protein CopZ [Methylobacterium sp. Leaf85]
MWSELAAALLVTLPTGAAFSHATMERKEASANASYRGVLQVTHGCNGEPTNRVSVTIPEGVIGAKPMTKPGWSVTTEIGPYAKPYPYYHGDISNGVKTITWSGGQLPDDQVDEFTFLARISDAFAPGETVYFPVEQDCTNGNHRWRDIPAPGQDAHALKSPAPGVTIVATQALAPSRAASSSSGQIKAGDLNIDTPWMRATPGGATVAGGYVRISNTGKLADKLISASIPIAASGSIHSMTMDGGVMKMAVVEGGLLLKPGETVELKPGSYHLMFEGLKASPKVGEPILGNLVFERAGTVPVTFAVAPIGARAPNAPAASEPAAGQHQH